MKEQFHPIESTLETGVTVIEASAGTGKTTAICAIVLRLIAQEEIPVERILVTTYTELVTAELRGRIRNSIAQALACATGQEGNFASFVAPIVEKTSDKNALRQRLTFALHNFDEAPIFTIHGFCARVLADSAFESGALFDCELVTDQSRLWEEIADDYWRTQLYPADALTSALVRDRLKPADFVALLEQMANNPRIRVLPEPRNLRPLGKKIAALPDDAPEREELTREFLVGLQANFCAWAGEEMRRRKIRRREQSFDDLLTQLDDALRSERGAALRQSLRTRFEVALIDEFQDTDPVQYSIFSQIYGGSRARVFYVGDPKQAIYGFRGADVFTYLKAARQARSYTLGKNWRSEAKLIEAVSAIFHQRDDAFVIPGIELPAIAGGNEADEEPFAFEGQSDQPLRFWISPKGDGERVEAAVAAEIARLLSGSATIGERVVDPRDIAVLVTANYQPAKIRDALTRFRIGSVVYTTASVFESGEAEELLRILRAVAAPGEERKLRAALATEILGESGQSLEILSRDEAAWERMLERFAQYHSTWRDKSFVAMMRQLLVDEGVRIRLLRYRDGERRLTNLLHLIELTHSACCDHRFGMDGLVAWLETQIFARTAEDKEEYELRLESDDAAVRIVTVHKSKGLQFGITFCPYIRKELRLRDFMKFHQGDELVLDLERTHQEEHKTEQLAELARELYVGLTRARHRSYAVWQERQTRSKAALAWMTSNARALEPFIARGEPDVGAALKTRFASSGAIAVEDLPDRAAPELAMSKTDEATFEPRTFHGRIDQSWGISSYSNLISGQTREPETPDDDSTEAAIETEPLLVAEGIHAFPGGTRAGTCLHKILEQIDYHDRAPLRLVVAQRLAQFHIRGFDDVVTETIERVLTTPLPDEQFALADVGLRLVELEFTFPMERVTPARLQKLFRTTEFPEVIGDLQFEPRRGFMKGFIDLVFQHGGKFYFADWKSNWLGPDASFYTRENLADVMSENFYTLQLSIYALALHRYLQQRLRDYDYERNFGGAFYIFLRGVDNTSRGIFDWRPPFPFIEKLDRLFHGNA